MTTIPIEHDRIMAHACDTPLAWQSSDALLYALSIGLGADPMDLRELPFVYEKGQKVFPTFAVILGFHGGPLSDLAIDQRHLLHGEHGVVFHGPIPPEGRGTARGRMLGAWDKGEGRGAVFAEEKSLFADGVSTPFATVVTTAFGRAEGGFGGPRDGQPKLPEVPDRAPDDVVTLPTWPSQALFYRLCADRNPLHADPATARAAGFERPILHGLCTFALCARAVLGRYGDLDPARLRAHALRFSSPVYPGEEISVEMWREGTAVAFQARVAARDSLVVRHGRSVVAEKDTPWN